MLPDLHKLPPIKLRHVPTIAKVGTGIRRSRSDLFGSAVEKDEEVEKLKFERVLHPKVPQEVVGPIKELSYRNKSQNKTGNETNVTNLSTEHNDIPVETETNREKQPKNSEMTNDPDQGAPRRGSHDSNSSGDSTTRTAGNQKRRGSLKDGQSVSPRRNRKRGSLVPDANEPAPPRRKLVTQKSDVNLLVDAFHGQVRKKSFVSAKGSLLPQAEKDDFADLKDLEEQPVSRKSSIRHRGSAAYSPVARHRASLTGDPSERMVFISPEEESKQIEKKMLKYHSFWCIALPFIALLAHVQVLVKFPDFGCEMSWYYLSIFVTVITWGCGVIAFRSRKSISTKVVAYVPEKFQKRVEQCAVGELSPRTKVTKTHHLVLLALSLCVYDAWTAGQCSVESTGQTVSCLGSTRLLVVLWPTPLLVSHMPSRWVSFHLLLATVCDIGLPLLAGARYQDALVSGAIELVWLGCSMTGICYALNELITLEIHMKGVMERFNRVNEHRLLLKESYEAKKEMLKKLLPQHIENTLSLKASKQMDSVVGICDTYKDVTILFCDLVGFTTWSAELDENDLVVLLSDLFSVFDMLTEKYGLEKIKTIGDCYMAAGGIPVEHENHAEKVVSMAGDMMNAVAEFRRPGTEIHLQARIGVHSGPLIAAVIGIKKLSYDVFGDTVNMASRMESSGIPGKVQLSSQTYEKVKNVFNCTKRKDVVIKGKGTVDTYLLNGRHSEMKDNDPNSRWDPKVSAHGRTGEADGTLRLTQSFIVPNKSFLVSALAEHQCRDDESPRFSSWKGPSTTHSWKINRTQSWQVSNSFKYEVVRRNTLSKEA